MAMDAELARLREENALLVGAVRGPRRSVDALSTLLRRLLYGPEAGAATRAAVERELADGDWSEADRALLHEWLAPVINFSWVIPGQVAGCGRPDSPAAVAALADRGVRGVVSLTSEPPPGAWLAAPGIAGHHVAGVADRAAPTAEQLAAAVRFIDASLAAERPVAVHCMAGRGRTGTVLAAYLVARGETAEGAIARMRALRPGSVESVEQEAAVRAYAQAVGQATRARADSHSTPAIRRGVAPDSGGER